MPPLEQTDRKQKAVLLPAIITSQGYIRSNKKGEVAVDVNNPVELIVRWTDVLKERSDSKGNTITIEAEAIVDRKVSVGSIMWKGTLDHYLGTGTGGASGGQDSIRFMRVETYDETGDIKNRFKRRVVSLCRYRKTLPTLP